MLSINNIFYRFQHLALNKKYEIMRAELRMNFIRQHGIDPVDFELWALAVLAVNGCGKSIDPHERVLIEKGFSEEKIFSAVRIASTIFALAVVFDAEHKEETPIHTEAYSHSQV
ncbi:MAG TPA: carboxymuconolactone decarboxylase family protein [Candidatus Koribacter sp.]|jgi:alkyl hydroperoxide reductase subunit D